MPLSPEQIAAANAKSGDLNMNPDGTLNAPEPQQVIVKPSLPPSDDNNSNVPPDDKPNTDDSSVDDSIDFSKFIDSKASIEELPAKPIEKKVEEPLQVVPPQPIARDYSDLEESDKAIFERMSNEAFNKLKPVYLEHKKLKSEVETLRNKPKDLPDSYYEHENGYMLTPEFTTLAHTSRQADAVYSHWLGQLKAVEEGAGEVEVLGVDEKGNLGIAGKRPVDAQTKVDLLSYVTFAQTQAEQKRAELKAYAITSKDRHAQNSKALQELNGSFFSAFDKDENKKVYEPVIKQIKEMLPPAYRNSPLADFTARSLVLNQILSKMVQSAQQMLSKSPGTKKPIKRAAPSAAEIAGDGGKETTNGEDVSFDQFEAIKNAVNMHS